MAIKVIVHRSKRNVKDAGGKVTPAQIADAKSKVVDFQRVLNSSKIETVESDDFEMGLKGLRGALSWFR